MDLNQTWPVGRKWCWFTNAPKKIGASPKFGVQKNPILTTFFATFALDTVYPGTKRRTNEQKC